MYKISESTHPINKGISILRPADNSCIPVEPDNTDYANFKADILADKATLQGADGNEMSNSAAKAFVASLP